MEQSLPGRIGMLGGTFNPIHNGHIQMAQAALEQIGLDRVLLMVDRDPPHKTVQDAIPASYRFEMARLAAQELGEPKIAACDIELKREGKSYTIDTLRDLQKRNPGAQLFCIVGGDMLKDLPNWKQAREIFRIAAIVAFAREGLQGTEQQDAQRLREEFGAVVHLLNVAIPPISSTQVRQHIRDALPISGLLPLMVEKYLYENGLYFPPFIKAMQEKLRAALNNNRYQHTMGVVRCAQWLAQRYQVNSHQARLAALLHDCGRGVDGGNLTHAKTSQRLARQVYGVTDDAVLRAIGLHTTGAPDMDDLCKIIYLADMIEPGRDYQGVAALRQLAQRDLNLAVMAGLRQTIDFVQHNGKTVDPASLETLEALQRETQTISND